MWRRAATFAATGMLAGCFLFPSVEWLDARVDGGDATEDARPSDAATDDQASGLLDVTGGESGASCASGAIVFPVRAFDASPSSVQNDVCSIDGVLVADNDGGAPGATPGSVTGLDRAGNESGTIDGHDVVGCIGVEFPGPVTEAHVRAASTPKACNTACLGPACNSGHSMLIFAGASEGSYTYVADPESLTTDFTDYLVTIPSSLTARYIVVCREINGPERDDVAVDSISGRCR